MTERARTEASAAQAAAAAKYAGEPDAPGGAATELMPLVYQELRNIARRERLRVSGGETLATTALIHEAYLRLAANPAFNTKNHFLRTASLAMRNVLVDRVRAQLAAKRGGTAEKLSLDDERLGGDVPDFVVEDEATVVAVHEALERLADLNPRLVEVVQCRFFAGYSEAETALALGTSERTVQRDWATARAWLRKELAPG